MGKTETGKYIGLSDEESKPPESISLILTNCCAFLAITLIITGELMHEQNMWAVLLIGGGLTSMNVLLTSIRIEHRSKQCRKDLFEMSARSRNTREEPHRSHVYVGDAISIDMDSLSDNNFGHSQRFDVVEDEEEQQIDSSHNRKHRKSKSKHLKIKVDKQKRRDGRTAKRLKDEDAHHRKRGSRRQKEKLKLEGRCDPAADVVDRTDKSSRKRKKRKMKRVRLAPEHAVIEV